MAKKKDLSNPDRVLVYARRDIKDDSGKVVIRKGQGEEVYTVDARERCARHPQDWSRVPVKGAAPAVPVEAPTGLSSIPGVTGKIAKLLQEAGYNEVADLAGVSGEDLAASAGIGTMVADSIVAHAQDLADLEGEGDDEPLPPSPIGDVKGISALVAAAFEGANIKTVADVRGMTAAELQQIDGVGKKSAELAVQAFADWAES